MPASSSASLAMPYLTLTAHPSIGSVLLDARPAWVWNSEGNRILWSNAAGLAFFEETSMNALMDRTFGDVHPARRHLARLSRNARINVPMLDRLRFFLGSTAVTASCLCKRLEVEGESVLLVVATDQPEFGTSEHDREQTLVDALGAETDLKAALLDRNCILHATSEALPAELVGSASLEETLIEADSDLRLAAKEVRVDTTDWVTAVARTGEETDQLYLVLIHDPSQLSSDEPDDLTLLFDELGASDDDLIDLDAMREQADIFGINSDTDNVLSLIEGSDRRNDADLKPFLSDQHQPDSKQVDGSNITRLNTKVPKLDLVETATIAAPALAAGTEISNIVKLPGAMERPDQGVSSPSILDGKDERKTSEKSVDKDENSGDFKFDKEGGPYHFVWESDQIGRMTHLSSDLSDAVGQKNAAVLGKNWSEIAALLEMDQDGLVAKAFEARETWAGLTVMWPVEGTDLRIPVELTGLPVFGRFHGFQGYRGFGVCYTNEAQSGPASIVTTDAQTASSEKESSASEDASHVLDNADLMSDALMIAAREAVATAEEAISPHSVDEQSTLVGSNDEKDGVNTVSEEFDDELGSRDENKDLAAQQAIEGILPEDENRLEMPNDPYELVTTLLSGSVARTKETSKSSDASPPTASDEVDLNGQELSNNELDAFDQIAEALTEQPDGAPDDDDETETAPAAPLEGEDTQSKEADIFAAKADDAAERDMSAQSKIQRALATRPRADDTVRSAANTAFRDILAMDPAFRHMRGHLAQLSGDSQPNTTSDVSVEDSDDIDLSNVQNKDGAETVTTLDAENSTPDIDQNDLTVGENEAPQASVSMRNELSIEQVDAEEPAEPESSTGTTEPEDSQNSAEDTSASDSSNNLATAAMAAAATGALGAGIASLWDRNDKSSPLIDLLNKLPSAIVVSADQEILFASKSALRLLGYDSASDLGNAGGMEGLFTGRPGDWLTKTDGRTTLRAATGKPLSVLASVSSVDWGDRPAAMLSFEEAPDKQPGIGLSEEDEKISELEAILDTATDGVVVLDGEGSILRMNHSAEALFEVDRHELAGQSFLSLLAEECHKDVLSYLGGLKQNGVASILNDGRDVIGRVQSGGLIPLSMTMGRVAIPGTNHFCAILRDVAQSKRDEEGLLGEKLKAEEASKQKSEFLAKVSHEIRTPLNAIIGFSEVMIEERFGEIGSERYKDYLKDIHTSGAHIMSLINDLLDLSKVEAGKLDLQFEATELNRLISESVGILQPQANREQIIIRTSLGSELPKLAADDRSLRQIVLNLLSNAVKFTPAGGQVIVSTSHEDNGEVILRIRDTGVGMTEDELKTALEPFRQISSTRKASEGTGLGLPLTKALVEANRAKMTITSEKNHGTMAAVTFPKERVIVEVDSDEKE